MVSGTIEPLDDVPCFPHSAFVRDWELQTADLVDRTDTNNPFGVWQSLANDNAVVAQRTVQGYTTQYDADITNTLEQDIDNWHLQGNPAFAIDWYTELAHYWRDHGFNA